MKKLLAILVMLTCTAFALFAETKNYTVVSINGKVQYEIEPGNWVDIKKGDILTSFTVINTGLNSKLILQNDDGFITIKPMQKGIIEKVLSSSGAVKNSVKGKLNVVKGETANDETVKSKGISTASSRASEAKEDLEWDE